MLAGRAEIGTQKNPDSQMSKKISKKLIQALNTHMKQPQDRWESRK